jgi:hypothetical protein
MTRIRLTYPATGPQRQSRTRLFSHGGFEVTTAAFFQSLGYGRRYDVAPTGDRLLMVRSPEESFTLGVPARVIVNWFDEIRQRVAKAEQR